MLSGNIYVFIKLKIEMTHYWNMFHSVASVGTLFRARNTVISFAISLKLNVVSSVENINSCNIFETFRCTFPDIIRWLFHRSGKGGGGRLLQHIGLIWWGLRKSCIWRCFNVHQQRIHSLYSPTNLPLRHLLTVTPTFRSFPLLQ